MSDADSAKRQRRARFQMLLIAAVAAFPNVGSYVLYQFWRPSSFVNHGELIASAGQALPNDDDPMSMAFKQVAGKWVIAMIDEGKCSEQCQKNLYFLRQIRLTQGKEMERIERMWIVTDGVGPAPASWRSGSIMCFDTSKKW